MKKKRTLSDDEARMTFTEHLAELRMRIIRSGVALLIGMAVCFIFYERIFAILAYPLRGLEEQQILVRENENSEPLVGNSKEKLWLILNPLEPFLVNLKLAAVGGIVLALPYVLFQMCAFVFPGLKPTERKAVRILLFGCSILVVLGVGLAYFGVFPLVLPYLMQYAPEGVEFKLRMNETLTLILKGLAGFAVAFQFPMVVFVLVYLGLLDPATLKRYRRVAVVGLALISALLTPPDVASMLLMLGPLVLLYEASIWISYVIVWRRKKRPAPA